MQLWRTEFELDGKNKFRQLVPVLTNKDTSLIVRGRVYSSCVQSSMLHGSETWHVRKENEVALQQAETRMVRWMCGIKLQDRVPNKLSITNLLIISDSHSVISSLRQLNTMSPHANRNTS